SRGGATDFRANPVAANDQFYAYGARGADLHLASRFIATPAIFDRDTFYGLEAAYVWGPWTIQSEYAQLKSDSTCDFVRCPAPIGAGGEQALALNAGASTLSFQGNQKIRATEQLQ